MPQAAAIWLIILLGITYLFGIARETGTIDWLVNRSIKLIGHRVALLPWGLWLIATGVACLGTSHAAFAVVPIAMSLAHTHRINSTLMGIAMSSAIVGGALAPTSINGITVMTVAQASGIPYNPALMFGLSVGINALVVLVAFFMFGGRELIRRTMAGGAETAPTGGVSAGAPTGGTSLRGGSATAVTTAPRADTATPTATLTAEAGRRFS